MPRLVKASTAAAALAAAAAGWMALASRGPELTVERVILLGFDGAAPNVIEPLVAQGKLPAVERLMQRGSYGRLKSFRPTKSGILWTSVATGKTMLKHGIIDWTYVNQEGIQVPYQDGARKAKTYWEILSERGVKVGTLNWWMSYPPRPIPTGYVVSNAFRHMQQPETVHPPHLFQRVKGLIFKYPEAVSAELERQGIPEWKEQDATLPLGRARNVVVSYGLYFSQDMTVDRVSDYLWETEPVQVFSTYFRLVDVTSHLAGRYLDRKVHGEAEALEAAGRLTRADEERVDRDFARVVAPAYQLMDRTIAKYLERMDDRTLLIVCSDHGFRFFKGGYNHGRRHMEPPDGVLFLAGPGVKKGYRMPEATLFDIAPTILYAMGLPVPKDMDGVVPRAALEKGYLARHPVETIATYESAGGKPGAPAAGKTDVDRDVLEDLRALGYIQAPGRGALAASPPPDEEGDDEPRER